ncbi:MAG: hypothetical protein ACTSWN_08500, partial [Promethearchaeota archaeon]
MLKPVLFGKLSIALPSEHVGSLLKIFGSKFQTQLKEITEFPIKLGEVEKIESDINIGDDSSLITYRFQNLEKNLNQVGKKLELIKKRLSIDTKKKPETYYSFHASNIDDLINKLTETISDIHYQVQDLFNKQISTARAINEARVETYIVEFLEALNFSKKYYEDATFYKLEIVIIQKKNLQYFLKLLNKEKIGYIGLGDVGTDEVNLMLIYIKKKQAVLDDAYKLYNVRIFKLRPEFFDADGHITSVNCQKRLDDLNEEKRRIEHQFKDLGENLLAEILAMDELYRNARRLLNYYEKMAFFRGFALGEFWVRVDEWERVERALHEMNVKKMQYKFTVIEREKIAGKSHEREMLSEDDTESPKLAKDTPP